MIKDPDDKRDITWYWAKDLGTDTIASAEFIVDPPGELTVQSTTYDVPTATATARIVGGTHMVTYDVTCRVTTSRGQQIDWTHKVLVKDQ